MQEQAAAGAGAPKALAVLLQDDLADVCQVGGELAGGVRGGWRCEGRHGGMVMFG